jgi:hypothetical protein
MDVDGNNLKLFQDLVREGPEAQEEWSKFLFNIPAALSLGALSSEESYQLLAQGVKWLGGGWSTARSSRLLHELTGVALVAGTVQHYRDAWLFCLALWFDQEVTLDLTAQASEAAFALFSVLAAYSNTEADSAVQGAPQEQESHKAFVLPTRGHPLPYPL